MLVPKCYHHLCIVLLLLIISTKQQQDCEACDSILLSKCKICYSNCDPNITVFLNCSKSSRQTYSQQQCFPTCCQHPSQIFTPEDLQTCQSNAQKLYEAYSTKVRIITISVMVSALSITILICIIVKCYQNRKQLYFCNEFKKKLRQIFCCQKDQKLNNSMTYQMNKY